MENPSTLSQLSQNYQPLPQNKRMTPCERYGLDISKLDIDELFQYRQYRRLYNIVATDQTQSVYEFRPNLIKQLYFLLQITPFIESCLQTNYLSSIQQWYDSNDHKKVALSKNIEGMLSNVLKSKNNEKRPKSGVQWDKSLSPFLRPYTAKLRKNKQNTRPDSSKYNLKSTCVDSATKYDEQDQQYIDQQYYNQPDLCDIQQEWQRSQDFKKNHRTLHPEQEPTFQRLIQLIRKADRGQFTQSSHQKNNRVHGFVRSSKTRNSNHLSTNANTNSTSGFYHKKRNIYSAVIKRQNSELVARQQLLQAKEQRQQQNGVNNQVQILLGSENQFTKLNEANEQNIEAGNLELQQEEQEYQNEQPNMGPNKKIYTKDSRTAQKGKMYTRVNGMKIIRPFTAKQNHIINRLDNYYQRQNNTNVLLSNQDKEFLQKYTGYVKNKTRMRIQMSRRSESKRYFDHIKSNKWKNKNVKTNNQDKQNDQNIVIISQPYQKSYLTLNRALSTNNTRIPYYSKQKFFKPNKAAQIKSGIFIGSAKQKKQNIQTQNQIDSTQSKTGSMGFHSPKSNQINNILSQKERFLSDQRFNPLHPSNLDQYNRQVLDDIQKIKEKLKGKNYASTDLLMKALYVDAPKRKQNFMSYKNQQGKQTNQAQALDEQLQTYSLNDQNKLELFDRRFLMVSKGQKKKKVKKRKLGKKGASKSLKK